MEKILFIVPPNINQDDFINPPDNVKSKLKDSGTFGSVITDMPLGILSLSAFVKKHSATETKLIDFNVFLNKLESFEFNSFKEFFCEILSTLEWIPDIIGISALFTPSYKNMLDIAQGCRDIFPNAVIVAGGGVPTNMSKKIFKDSLCFDALCYGEGEKPLLGLVKAENKFKYLEENQSWITWKKIEDGQSFNYDFIENLDEIPFNDFSILKVDDYNLDPTISAYSSISHKNHNFPIMTSRGCVFNCCFCASHSVHGKKMRYHSIDRVREDLKRLRNKYGAEIIIFQDDHLMAKKQRAIEIINTIKELQMTAFFPNSLALYALDREVLESLKNAGVNQLVLSIESGSNRVLKEIMHKPLNLHIIKQVANDCHELGIYTDVNILIGLPGETKQDIEDTRNFLKTISVNWFRINVTTPLVGSEMLDICLKNNYLKENYVNSGFKKAIVETEDFTAEYIQEKAYFLNLELNFIENKDFRLGNYEIALRGFENAIKAKNDHAIAYYYASKCYEKLGDSKRARQYIDNAKKIVTEKPFWRKYAESFKIKDLLENDMLIKQKQLKPSEIERRNKLKAEKPYVYEKILKFDEKIRKGESIAIIQFQYNYLCNFRCEHCSIKRFQGKKDGKQFTLQDVKELARQADEMGLARFVITGGEPLVFADLDELVAAIDPQKFYINCDTNGWFLDEEKAKHLKSIGIDRIQLSIDSLDAEEHDKFRRAPGSHARCIRAIDAALNAGLDIFVQTVVTKQRIHSEEFIKFIEYFNKKGVGVFVSYAKPVGSWEGNYDVLVDKNDMKYMEELEKKYKVFTHLTPAYGLNMGCIAVKGMISITQHGDVLPCPYIHISIGNVFEEPLKDIVERGLKIKHFGEHRDTCLIAEDREFIKKYIVNGIYGKSLPVPYDEVFGKEDFIEGPDFYEGMNSKEKKKVKIKK